MAIFLKPIHRLKKVYVTLSDYHDKHLYNINWNISAEGYLLHKGTSHCAYFHRIVFDAPKNMVVDHINHNKLDNRQSNLRLATKSQNGINRKSLSPKNQSGHRGVSFNKTSKLWNAFIKVNSKTIFLGCFKVKEKAAEAYQQAAKRFFGEFFHG